MVMQEGLGRRRRWRLTAMVLKLMVMVGAEKRGWSSSRGGVVVVNSSRRHGDDGRRMVSRRTRGGGAKLLQLLMLLASPAVVSLSANGWRILRRTGRALHHRRWLRLRR